MIRRPRVIWTATAVFAFGIAFAAQPADREDPSRSSEQRSWVPGTVSPMSAYETRMATLAPPQ
ncbi:MAG: hypothetical protein WB440_01745 [Steroidobacteraceae bacterium]|jgi:hypothetical protein